jgi:hypothetical protein
MAPPSTKKQKRDPASSQDIMGLFKKAESVASSQTGSTVPGSPAPASASSSSSEVPGSPAPFTPVAPTFDDTAVNLASPVVETLGEADEISPGQPQPAAEPRSAKKELEKCIAKLFATSPTGDDTAETMKVLVIITIIKHV